MNGIRLSIYAASTVRRSPFTKTGPTCKNAKEPTSGNCLTTSIPTSSLAISLFDGSTSHPGQRTSPNSCSGSTKTSALRSRTNHSSSRSASLDLTLHSTPLNGTPRSTWRKTCRCYPLPRKKWTLSRKPFTHSASASPSASPIPLPSTPMPQKPQESCNGPTTSPTSP